MKKITAFFMALFPILVVGLLFATGLISKNFVTKTVTALEMKDETLEIQKTEDGEHTEDISGNVTVFPSTATDPTVYWTSQDTNIATIDKEKGIITCKDYGDVKIDAVAKTNAQAKAQCTVKVWDDKIHRIEVTNEAQAKFVAPNSQFALQVKTVPSEKIAEPTLSYSVTGPDENVKVSQTGIITAGSQANGEYTVTIKNIRADGQGVSKEVKVTVGSSIESIGFKQEGTTVIQESTYNLFNEVVAYPYAGELDPAYFTFASLDESSATIDNKGVIHFANDYMPGTPVRFIVKFAGLDSIAATKVVTSSLNYYDSVNFEQYGYTESFSSFTNAQEITDIKFHTYPAKGNGSVKVESSNPDVVKVENDKIYALKPGKATLTVSADASQKFKVSDKVDVTIVNSTNPGILTTHDVNTGTSYYYPLRKALSSEFENRSIKWTATDTDKAFFDENKEIVYFKDADTITVTAQDLESKATETIKITCPVIPTTTVDTSTGEAIIAAGQKVIFKNGTNVVTPNPVPEELVACANNAYVAIAGSKESKTVQLSDGSSISLLITEPMISISTANKQGWYNYTTNTDTFDLSKTLLPYPSTATYANSWGAYVPEIEYTCVPEDDSAITFEDNVLKFVKPTSVAITATYEDITKSFRVTSYCGQNGKFCLNDGKTNAIVQSGVNVQVAPGETFSYYLDASNFYLKDSQISVETLNKFKVTNLGNDTIVSAATPIIQDNKFVFAFSANTTGSDVIKISNGSFTFIINLTVTSAVSDANLYCLGNKLAKGTTINAYDKTNLFVNLDLYPLVAVKDDVITVTLGGTELKPTGGTNRYCLDTLTSTQDLVVTNKAGKQLAKYTIKDCSADTPTLKVLDPYSITLKEITAGSTYTLPANSTIATLILDIGGICSQEYFANKIEAKLGDTAATIQGKYVFMNLPKPAEQPGYSAEFTVGIKSATAVKYNLKRDLVGRVELPKHDNLDETDAKGLQRVHVYGNKTQYAGKEVSNVYSLPINVYDWQGNLIGKDDIAAKNAAVATLVGTFNNVDIQTLYNKTTGNFDITFDSTNLYTWQEMFDNKFEELTKNQTFKVSTLHGQDHKLEDCYAQYSFVVVNGINVYDQKGIETAAKTTEKSIVLQTNFGLTEDPTKPMKDDTPFELTTFDFNEVYGNGYSINFHAATKAAGASDKTITCKHGFNTNMVGCWYSQFTGLNHRAITFANGGECDEANKDTWAYCTFTSFHQPLTIWCKEGKKAYAHIKNCMFFNDQEYCRNAMSISDSGNTTIVENCAFFNAAKIAIMANKGAIVQFKGDIDVYNFHGSDMFDCMGWEPLMKEAAWLAVETMLRSAGVIQEMEYGSVKPKCNAYLMTTFGGTAQFYDHTEGGKDIYIDADHGSEKAANYLINAAGLRGVINIWSTVKPPLPLQLGHAPAFSDEFINGEQLNYNVRNYLIQKISRW